MRRLGAQRRVLDRDPPADFFLSAYFVGQGWWNPKWRQGSASQEVADIPPSDLPEYEP